MYWNNKTRDIYKAQQIQTSWETNNSRTAIYPHDNQTEISYCQGMNVCLAGIS